MSEVKRNIPNVFTVSDGTGETALNIVKAVKAQFENAEMHVNRYNKISSREMIDVVLQEAKDKQATVVATIVNPDLRVFLMSRSMQLGVRVVDVLFPLLETLSAQLGQRPSEVPGRLRLLDKDYFKRIWALEYTVRHDDGLNTQDLNEADIVLVGVSRTSKTPLSIYLGHKGYKVANIPVVPNTQPPENLFKIDQKKIVGLLIDPDRLSEIRTARIKALGMTDKGDYADSKHVFEEVEWCRDLFRRNKTWPVIDVTGRAVEENAVEVEQIILSRFPHFAEI